MPTDPDLERRALELLTHRDTRRIIWWILGDPRGKPVNDRAAQMRALLVIDAAAGLVARNEDPRFTDLSGTLRDLCAHAVSLAEARNAAKQQAQREAAYQRHNPGGMRLPIRD